ncbi:MULTISPECIES: RagB/SusD family nutrient uptake outer membrane protein [Myroides]|uniref:RagB/SusD family nutrient uptake outer membrane protein n=1 Tax=Myroides albus TaxID=2562892 RepID=A0A6I3LPF0_9FLAO|nr:MULTISPECIES: RagB/SusD family nutrient uptake outer membrane protein [Myroides]MTG98541.1 RagB/SusD family nutrient uptake outer membrane protein [Myroides albus]MVX36215.1 RagB/SusD family nutrient uptake outer membrane protein [Myroides sp. LoEW2-1]
MKTYILTYKTLISLYLFLLVISTSSCTKLVDIDSSTTQIDKTDVYNDLSTTKAALNNLYLNLSNNSLLNKSGSGISFNLSIYTDALDYYGTNISGSEMYLNTFSDNNSQSTSWWNTSYQHLYAINDFIQGVTNTDAISIELKQKMLGEALTLRALYYHYLAQLYGDIPYTTSTNYLENKNISKTTYLDVLTKIELDLNQAIEYLDYTYTNKDKFYINKTVPELLLIENYILQKKYQEAEELASSIIDRQQYKIEDDLLNTFKKEATSTIWQFSPLFLTANSATPEATLYIFSNFTTSSSVLSKKVLSLFDDNDKRKQHWLNKIIINDQTFYQVYKYKNKTNNLDEFSILYRIEQIYIDLAFALTMQEKQEQALTVLNQLRQKRGLSDLSLTLSKQETINAILEEDLKEFYTENGRRFFSLKRAGKLNELTQSKPNFRPYHDLFPIPSSQIQINKNLLPNNPGY